MNGQGANKGVLFFLVIIILGAILGGVLGEILGLIVTGGILNRILVTGISLSLSPATLDLAVLSFTFGVGMKLNLLSVFGIAGAMWLFYKM
ncbi:MAG: DUF4321 domain-containing protein [Candidatus Omnitrophica bacterium]|nr:DUF4321 domain-containing protein [Candidatus Omnitrophota bacterium]MBU1047090.1 DUF4321 domain-containing protein [Candidatus Omnitrophota bacterium]MBU1631542.1 DUF4321 domain-containing protein [Candidatus Omnitrophota bacterium]MBU1767722.1 DUF4321 domain-containing protein [Candidatus Omnitrophota bacterium]MBU1888756.1 DUF4321 domain-containing protein [Candidatus Omnitrophota bacterium]